jgi:hypothetical protein
MIQLSDSAREMEWANFMAELQGTMSAEQFRAHVAEQDREHRRRTARMVRFLLAYLGILGTACFVGWLVMRQW